MSELDTENPAPWYTSRSLWGAIVAGASAAAQLGGHAVAPDLVGPIVDLCLNLATVIGTVVAAEGRITATKTIRR